MHGLRCFAALALVACTGISETDTDIDTDIDTDLPEEWACPVPEPYVGDGDWPWALRVTTGATLCGTFDESRTLEDELAAKAQLQVAPGRFPMPLEEGESTFRLPVCLVHSDGTSQAAGAAGLLRASVFTYNDWTTYNADLRQEFVGGGGLAMGVFASAEEGEVPDDYVLDSGNNDPFGDSGASVAWCRNPDDEWCSGPNGTQFVDCAGTGFGLQTHTLTFEGGEVVLHVRMGQSAAGTEPAAFVRAVGTIDGAAFDQDDYWKLIYSPEHHHFSRDFAVLFDAPIGGACGIKVLDLDPWEGAAELPKLSLIECDLTDIESRTVTQNVWDRG
ncbi:MAG: hypothetical protein AB8H79_22580 [Myxococcota bacterium]